MRIFHIATAADWAAARRSGSYTTSTYGRSLREVGFVHAARREQVGQVFHDFYRDVREPLVLLTIDTDRLDVPWREEVVGEDTYPHVYGAVRRPAVLGVAPLNRGGGTESVLSLFFREMLLRAALVVVALLLATGGAALGGAAFGGLWAMVGAAVGFAIGVVGLRLVLRRRA